MPDALVRDTGCLPLPLFPMTSLATPTSVWARSHRCVAWPSKANYIGSCVGWLSEHFDMYWGRSRHDTEQWLCGWMEQWREQSLGKREKWRGWRRLRKRETQSSEDTNSDARGWLSTTEFGSMSGSLIVPHCPRRGRELGWSIGRPTRGKDVSTPFIRVLQV